MDILKVTLYFIEFLYHYLVSSPKPFLGSGNHIVHFILLCIFYPYSTPINAFDEL